MPTATIPYSGSFSVVIVCPPITGTPASSATARPPRKTSASSSRGSTSTGQPTTFSASVGVPPIA